MDSAAFRHGQDTHMLNTVLSIFALAQLHERNERVKMGVGVGVGVMINPIG